MMPVKNETNGGVVEEEKWEGEHISYLVQAGAGATNKSQFLSRSPVSGCTGVAGQHCLEHIGASRVHKSDRRIDSHGFEPN